MRGRPPAIVPSEALNLRLPADLKLKMDLHLFSELEGRVPKGAYAGFISGLVREFFTKMEKTNVPS